MGSSTSSEEKIEEKTIDAAGHVNNNIVIQEARDTHTQMLVSERLLLATYMLVIFEIIKLAAYLYGQCRSKLKKRYGKPGGSSGPAPPTPAQRPTV